MRAKSNLFLALIASLTLGLAPFFPEPHLIGKLKWIMGGGVGMGIMDYGDLLMHGLPWLFLLYLGGKYIFGNKEVDEKLQQALLEKETTIVDVREVGEFKSGHIASAKNIPLSGIKGSVKEFKKMKGPIVLYCRSGIRSGKAKAFLKGQGLQNVFNGGSLSKVKKIQTQVMAASNVVQE